MEFRLYLMMLRRGWWTIVLTTLIALAVALGVSYLATPQYTAVARFIVGPSTDLVNGSEVISSLNTLDSQSVMSTYAEIMNSNRIFNDTLAFLQASPEQLKHYSYSATVVTNSSVLELSVTGPDPQFAATIANAIGYQTINFTRGLNQVYTVEFLDTATPPDLPSSPKPLLNSILGVVLGLVTGAILSIAIEQLRIPLEVFRQWLQVDNITGVYNSRYFSRLVEDEIAQHPNDVFSIAIVELSGLRDLVETFPIPALQRVFQSVTDTLRRELRGNDVIGRWNETSFIVMLPNTPGAAANSIFIRIFQTLSRPIALREFDLNVHLDARIGGAEYSNNISSQELFEKINNALEEARRATGDPVYIWEIKNPFWSRSLLDEK